MYSLKISHLARDLIGADVVEYYRDMRTFGKDYERFYRKVREENIDFVRYEDIAISKDETGLLLTSTDLFNGDKIENHVDMVILSTGMEPHEDQQHIASTFGISLSPDGFFLEKHPKLAPAETATDGVFLAGTCQGPKDIPDTVAQAGAAAAAALSLMDFGQVTLEPFTAFIRQEKCSGCLICVNTCPYHAIESVQLNGHLVSQVNEVICKGCGTCVAACPSGAACQLGFTSEQVMAEIGAILTENILQEVAN